jgi:hypothetical protein
MRFSAARAVQQPRQSCAHYTIGCLFESKFDLGVVMLVGFDWLRHAGTEH